MSHRDQCPEHLAGSQALPKDWLKAPFEKLLSAKFDVCALASSGGRLPYITQYHPCKYEESCSVHVRTYVHMYVVCMYVCMYVSRLEQQSSESLSERSQRVLDHHLHPSRETQDTALHLALGNTEDA